MENNRIFNQKNLLKNAIRDVKLEKNDLLKRRKILNKWIRMHKDGTLKKQKEESLKDGFLLQIFGDVLKYVKITDSKEWNLAMELKTKIDGQKADGVLGFFNNKKESVRVVIELKGPYVDLEARQRRQGENRTPIEQAFGYVPKYDGKCEWVIVSNFYEIRLYPSRNMSKYEIFNLDMLQETENFQKFIYLLSKTALIGDNNDHIPKIKELFDEDIRAEKKIEKNFYTLYKGIREKIFKNLLKNNKEINENVILEKTQKLMDRFLFVVFAESKGLLKKNSYNMIVKKGSSFLGIFEMFKTFCGWINSGNKQYKINKYNGGLFAPDSILDGLLIEDAVFYELEKLSEYDFESQMSENILGHIFEQSISDLEELKDEINKIVGKRKKDGIFYTPKHITKIIVENAVGNWLEDRKIELGFYDLPKMTKIFTQKDKLTEEAKKHLKFWKSYREVVKKVKIIDPACGSGAFLIEVFDYLARIGEEINKQILSFDLSQSRSLTEDINKSILLNNIYGVDLSSESVEITKLALWLKTADKDKPLENLDKNIKCGNSIINNKKNKKSFDWSEEFKEVSKYGGFDIVIGNPPYIRHERIKEYKPYLEENYKVYTSTANLYCYFYELGYKLLKNNGYLGYITSNKWFRTSYGKNLRKFLLEKTEILTIIDYNGVKIFDGATVDPNILVFRKLTLKNQKILISKNYDHIIDVKIGDGESFKYSQKLLSSENFSFVVTPVEISIKEKIKKIGKPLKEWNIKINYGVKTGLNDAFIINKQTRDELVNADFKNSEIIKPILRGRDIKKYSINFSNLYLIALFPSKNYDIENYPKIKQYFLNKIGFDKLKQTGDKGSRKKTRYKWFETQDNIAYYKNFEIEKIVYPETTQGAYFVYDNNNYYLDKTCFMIVGEHLKYLNAILSSKLYEYVFKKFYSGQNMGKSSYQYNKVFLEKLPVKPFSNRTALEKRVSKILENNKKILDYKVLYKRYEIEKQYDKLIDLDKLIEICKRNIQEIDYEINQEVYNIYGLNDKEIKFIEK